MAAIANVADRNETPRAERTCGYCVYGLPGLSEEPETRVCVNQLERPVRIAPPEPPSDEIRYIALTQGTFAIVDAADYEWLSQRKWHITKGRGRKCYAATYGKGRRTILMHRLIMDPPEGMVVDHIDGNGLNNRRSNLRICTQMQNVWNCPGRSGASRFKGVSFHQQRRKWEVRTRVGGRPRYLGCYDDEIEAALAYDLTAVVLMGQFAYLNFPRITGATRQAAHLDRASGG